MAPDRPPSPLSPSRPLPNEDHRAGKTARKPLPPQEDEMRGRYFNEPPRRRIRPGWVTERDRDDAIGAGQGGPNSTTNSRGGSRWDRDQVERTRWMEQEAERQRRKERIAKTGMRGWGEVMRDETEREKEKGDVRAATPERDLLDDEQMRLEDFFEEGEDDDNNTTGQEREGDRPTTVTTNPNKPSLSMRIFGIAGSKLKQHLGDIVRETTASTAASRLSSPLPLGGRASTSTSVDAQGEIRTDHLGLGMRIAGIGSDAMNDAGTIARAVLSRAAEEQEEQEQLDGYQSEDRLSDDIWGAEAEEDLSPGGKTKMTTSVSKDTFASASASTSDIAKIVVPQSFKPTEQASLASASASADLNTTSTSSSKAKQTPLPALDRARLIMTTRNRAQEERKEKILSRLLREKMARIRRDKERALAEAKVEAEFGVMDGMNGDDDEVGEGGMWKRWSKMEGMDGEDEIDDAALMEFGEMGDGLDRPYRYQLQDFDRPRSDLQPQQKWQSQAQSTTTAPVFEDLTTIKSFSTAEVMDLDQDLTRMEAKARSKARLNMRLNKEKAVLAKGNGNEEDEQRMVVDEAGRGEKNGNGKENENEDGVVGVADGQDRASLLRAKLLASRRAKRSTADER